MASVNTLSVLVADGIWLLLLLFLYDECERIHHTTQQPTMIMPTQMCSVQFELKKKIHTHKKSVLFIFIAESHRWKRPTKLFSFLSCFILVPVLVRFMAIVCAHSVNAKRCYLIYICRELRVIFGMQHQKRNM